MVLIPEKSTESTRRLHKSSPSVAGGNSPSWTSQNSPLLPPEKNRPQDDEEPPAYQPSSRRSSPSSPPRPIPPPLNTSVSASSSSGPPATNHLSIKQKQGVKGTWRIDPSLVIPAAFLPPLDSEDENEGEAGRANLSLTTRHGGVEATVHLVGEVVKRAKIRVKTKHGGVTLRTTRQHHQKVNMIIKGKHGRANIYLPTGYQGPLTLTSTRAKIEFSPLIAANLTEFSTLNGTKRCFLGDFTSSGFGQGNNWLGDECIAENKFGGIRIFFEEEFEGKDKGKGKMKEVPALVQRSSPRTPSSGGVTPWVQEDEGMIGPAPSDPEKRSLWKSLFR